MAPLTKNQRMYLAQLARRAWNLAGASRFHREEVGEAWDGSEKGCELWRHGEVSKACGKLGLRCCDQGDYKLVEGHFFNLLGETNRAFHSYMRAQTESRRVAAAVLRREVARAERVGITMAYVAAICRRQFKCGLLAASEKQLWNLVYTVRNRAVGRRRERLEPLQREAATERGKQE